MEDSQQPAIEQREGKALPGDWTGMVVFYGNTVWDGNQFASQHMAGRLSRRAPVLYVDPPLSLISGRRDTALAPALEGPRLRMIRPGLARLTPVTIPAFTRPIVRDISNVLLRRTLRNAVASMGVRPHAVIADTPLPLLGAVDTDINVYYATDDFTAGAELMGLGTRWVGHQVAREIKAADKIITVSEHFAEICRAEGLDSTFVPNGCDDAAYVRVDDAPWPSDVTLPGPVAGFVGYLSARIDLSYLEAVADRGVSVLLVGPRQLTFDRARIEPLLARPNVQWVGPKPFAELPSYLRAIDVGLVPYHDSAFNRASFPLKTLEYLAAGRDVVATDLPSIRWLDTDLITIRSGSADFADAVEKALTVPRTPRAMEARRDLAAQHSWDDRADQVADLLGLPNG